MVRSIARYAVIRKTQKDVNILTGNYEAAYAEGLLFHILNLHPKTEELSGRRLKEERMEALQGDVPADDREKHLIHMLEEYKPSDIWDEDTEAMLKMGLEEDPQNFLLMHAIGSNVSGQIASVIAGGIILNMIH